VVRHVTGPFPVSPVPALAGEVDRRLLGTGHRLEPDMPVELDDQLPVMLSESVS